jgi:hypothetical protein
MTLKFSKTSTQRLETCHHDIKHVMRLALYLTDVDFFIAEGLRSEEKQTEYFMTGASKVKYPNSYHNDESDDPESLAVDAVPWANGKAIWSYKTTDERAAWDGMVRAIKLATEILNVPLDWGFDLWKWDRPHWQLTRYRG